MKTKWNKMRIIYTIALLLFIQNLYGINGFRIGDTLTVWAESGLNLRSERGKESKIIAKIPFGEKVVTKTRKGVFGNDFFISDRANMYNCNNGESYTENIRLKGSWVWIKWKGKEGYVFDAYLSKLSIPNLEKDYYQLNGLELFQYYFGEYIKLESEWTIDYLFKDKLLFKKTKSDNKVILKVVLYDFSFEELYLITNYQLKSRLGCQLKQYIREIEKKEYFNKITVELECGYFEIYEYGDIAVFNLGLGC
jgi:hypothetical protein